MLDGEPAKGKKRGRARNAPQFDLRTQLFKMCGVVDGLSPDTSRPEDGLCLAKGQACGLARPARLCPGTKITGGLGVSGKTKRVANRAAQALRLAAAALRTSQSALGAYFRRMGSRMDKPKAVTAAAHKLARLICTMLIKGQEYADQSQAYDEERHRERVVRQLRLRANKLGMQFVAYGRTADRPEALRGGAGVRSCSLPAQSSVGRSGSSLRLLAWAEAGKCVSSNSSMASTAAIRPASNCPALNAAAMPPISVAH